MRQSLCKDCAADPVGPLLTAAIAVAGTMLTAWVVSLFRRDASIVDIAWGLGFVILAWAAAAHAGFEAPRTALLLGMVSAWGLRLAIHLGRRNLREGEDRRYREMRARIPRFALVSLVTVFALQGVAMWVVALPVTLALGDTGERALGLLGVAGVALWGIGLAFETTADAQLARFRANPAHAGLVMDRGLWRYSRHPNYFGDACAWWGIGLAAVEADVAAHAWTLVGPLLMTVLLMRVSGVPLLEPHLRASRPGYEAYARRTSAFVPLPPKRGRNR